MAKNKEHTRNTLMHMTKEELVDYCLMLEHNNHALAQSFEIQYKNMLDLMKIKDNIDERLVVIRGGGTRLKSHEKWGYVLIPVIGPDGWMNQAEFDKYKEYLKPYINELIVLLRWLSYVKE